MCRTTDLNISANVDINDRRKHAKLPNLLKILK
jgi:hypothetical protein